MAQSRRLQRALKALLLHRSVWVRFVTLWASAAAVCLVAWYVGYALLPEGILRGRLPAQALAGGSEAAGSFLREWLRIFAINLTLAAVFIAGAGLMRDENGYPLSYLVPLVWAAFYGVLLGTNSFSFSLPGGRMAPSLAVFGRSGPFEISAYVLLAVALRGAARYRIVGRWWSLRQRLQPVAPEGFSRQDRIGVAVALLVLALSNAREAWHVMAVATGP